LLDKDGFSAISEHREALLSRSVNGFSAAIAAYVMCIATAMARDDRGRIREAISDGLALLFAFFSVIALVWLAHDVVDLVAPTAAG
jgi:hypothetical protein